MEAAQGIAVHLEDRAGYDRAMAVYDGRVPAYVYLAGDGPQPKYPPRSSVDTRAELIEYWHRQSTFTDGLAQETCRDFGHTGYGVASVAHVAETSRIQGQDVYPRIKDRLRHLLGFHTKYENGAAVPPSLCGGSLKLGLGPVTEVGHNALNNRMGVAMDNTRTCTQSRRPHGTENHYVAWETLTHAGKPR
jgi:hypothetical protein